MNHQKPKPKRHIKRSIPSDNTPKSWHMAAFAGSSVGQVKA